MQYNELKSFILNKLENELPDYLTYHNVTHTVEVLKHAEELAVASNISGKELTILKTAAVMHDAGFLETKKLASHLFSMCRCKGFRSGRNI